MKSITVRLTIGYSIIVTVTVVVLLCFGRYHLERNLIDGVDLLIDAEFEEIKSRIGTDGEQDAKDEIIASIQKHTEIDASMFMFQIGARQGDVFYTSNNMGQQHFPTTVHGERAITVEMDEIGDVRICEYSLNGLDIHIGTSLKPVTSLFRDYLKTSVFATLLAFLVSSGLGYLISRLALAPIRSIQETARRITARNLNERIKVPAGGDEITHLAELLNDMIARLEDSFNQIKRFTANASHELRTPLSLIRLQSEKLLNTSALNDSEKSEALHDQLEEINRLNKIIDDLLFLTKADAGLVANQLKFINTAAFIESFAEDAMNLCEDSNLQFELTENEPVQVEVDPIWMRHVLLNLLSNAIKYSTPHGKISLYSHLKENTWEFAVEDEGPGIREEDLDRIFDHFYRSSQYAPESVSGSGMGLAICRSIVTQHNGSIFARNRPDHSGLCIVVRIPLK